jgi:tellurite resistance protein TehA-like permease
MQVGIIVFGVLASGCYREFITTNARMLPAVTVFVFHYGFCLFAIPIIWIASAVLIHRGSASEEWKSIVFVLGLILLLSLVAFFGYANVRPLLFIDWGVGGIEE